MHPLQLASSAAAVKESQKRLAAERSAHEEQLQQVTAIASQLGAQVRAA
jgi:hypothetical protein